MPPVNSPQWWEDYFRRAWEANGGGEQTRHFMQRLIAELPAAEADHLRHRATSIVDWGCAQGEGVDELGRAFGAEKVFGLDIAHTALETARRRFPSHRFLHPDDAAVPRRADVVVSSNCLEHFAEPWRVAVRLARAARDLLILMVPCEEEPLCASHVVRFDERGFPPWIGGLRLLGCRRVAVDPRHWNGDQLLAVYASPRYPGPLSGRQRSDSERSKWERHYATAQFESESPAMARFGAEFAAMVSELLPAGGRVLEAGAGAGWHSLALARTGRFEVTLLDFSEQALRHARAHFEREGQRARFVLGDAREHGEPDHDLVFNSGVLEHLPFAERVELVSAMASRSRNFVLTLVPNPRCYWYWIWRILAGGRGDWPFGQELPLTDLPAVFEAAGLDVRGERVLGQDWTESFFQYLGGMGSELREGLLAVHRSPLIEAGMKGYLLATLGSVAAAGPGASEHLHPGVEPAQPLLASALADALALQVRMHGETSRLTDERDRWQRAAAESEAVAARLLRESAAEREHWGARVARQEGAAAEARAEAARLAAELREAEARCRRLAEAEASASEDLRRVVAEQARLERDRDRLARAHEGLLAWQAAVEDSRPYRWLQRLQRLRGALRWR